MTNPCIVLAARYTAAQRSEVLGYRRQLASLKNTRELLISKRADLLSSLKTETMAGPSSRLRHELSLVRSQLQEVSAQRRRIGQKLQQLRMNSYLNP